MSTNFKNQQGAVLVITLVILAVITLISVSELNQAGQQVKMITNVQQRDLAFQAAESAMAEAMETIDNSTSSTEANITAMATAVDAQDGAEVPVTNTTMSDSDMAVTVSYKTSVVNSLRPGISLDASENDFTVRTINFTATSTATIVSSGATATVIQGFTYE